METIQKGKQTNKQTSGGGMCGGADAGGSAELHNMQSPVCNASEYVEELQRCIRDALEKCGVRYAGSYSDSELKAHMPAVSFLHSSTNGCRNELKSFGAFGPGMMLR